MNRIRANADRRASQEAEWSERVEKLVADEKKGGRASDRGGRAENSKLTSVGSSIFANAPAGSGSGNDGGSARPAAAIGVGPAPNVSTRNSSKRGSSHIEEASDGSDIDEAMDVDDDEGDDEGKKRALKRKLQG